MNFTALHRKALNSKLFVYQQILKVKCINRKVLVKISMYMCTCKASLEWTFLVTVVKWVWLICQNWISTKGMEKITLFPPNFFFWECNFTHFCQIHVKTLGWIGFGLSSNGNMPGGDFVIGWIDAGVTYFHVSQKCSLNVHYTEVMKKNWTPLQHVQIIPETSN